MIRNTTLAFSILLMACGNNNSPNQTTDAPTTPVDSTSLYPTTKSSIQLADTLQASSWMIDVIKNHFAENNPEMEAMTTSDYFEYKTDATNIDLGINGSLDRVAFENKWKAKFDTKYAGIQNGFLISGQDYGNIVVHSFDFVKEEYGKLWFKVILEDTDFKIKYNREIGITKENDQFKIADVKEFE